MKLIKGIGYFVLIIFAAVLLAAAFAPAEKEITRSIIIEKPANEVFVEIAEFRNWKNWDAWYKRDTSQERVYTGGIGDDEQSYTWASENENVGNGRMKMTSISGNERLNYRFYFDNGGAEDSAQGHFALTEVEGTTTVDWTMISTVKYPWKIFNYFIESMVGPDFEQGLSNLKRYVEEKKPLEQESYAHGDVKSLTQYGINYIAVTAENLPMSNMSSFFEEGYKKVYEHLKSNELEAKGAARGLIYTWDEEKQITTIAAAVPISDLLKADVSKIALGADSAFLGTNQIEATSNGGYSENYKAHLSLYEWIETNQKELLYPVVEEYLVGPLQTQDTSQFQTRIIYHFE